jgi:class 3 adenylate cyclase
VEPRDATLATTFRRLSEEMPTPLAEKVLASRGRIDGERKQVTVLFSDLVGSVTIAEAMDPEDYREILDRFLAVVFEQVYRYEGVVNQIAGDGVMALFGAPVAHEDAPGRAIHAALAIRDGVSALSEDLSREGRPAIEIRIGINTGPVIVGTVGNDLKMDYTAIGDTTNLAARLQTVARPNTLLISDATARFVRAHFALRPLGPFAVRGKSLPVSAYEVSGPLEPSTALAFHEPALSPFVGRSEELRRLEDAFARTAGNAGQVVAVVGDAGLGKSRLLQEFQQRIGNRARILSGECFSYARGVPYHPFVSMLRRFLGIIPGDSDAAPCDRLAELVKTWDPDLTVAFPALCRVLSLETTAAPSLSEEELQWTVFDAVARMILVESERTPVIVALEDIQWTDEASAELLANLITRLQASPVLIVCTYRPEYHPPWSHRPNVTQVALAPLSPAESTEIIRAVAGGSPPPELVRVILAKAEGNPFFTEEVTRGLIEDGVVVETAHGPMLTRALDDLDVPATVQEIVAARLDRLPPPAKRLVQAASVVGRHFRADIVEDLLADEGIDVRAQLRMLEQSEVVYPKEALSHEEYVFRHALTQEVAYHGLLLRHRRQLHEEVGLALERRYGANPGDMGAVLAFHFRNSDTRDKALRYLLQAAYHAEAVPSYASAADLYQQAWEIGRAEPESEAHAKQALEAGLRILGILAIFGEGKERTADVLSSQVEELVERVGTTTDRIAAATFTGLLQIVGPAERFESGLAQLEAALRLAEKERSDVWRWRIERGLALGYVLDGRFDDALHSTETVLAEVVAAGEDQARSDLFLWTRLSRDRVLVHRDDLERGLVECEHTHQLAVEHDNRSVQLGSSTLIANLRLLRGEFGEARAAALRGLELAEAINVSSGVPNLAAIVVLAHHAEGAPLEAGRYLDQIEEHVGPVTGVQHSLRFVTDAFVAAGDLERAERVAQSVRRRSGGRLRQAYSAIALGDLAVRRGPEAWRRAQYFFEEAVRVAREIETRSLVATALLGQARLLALQTQLEPALAVLAEATTIFRELGMQWHVAQSERLHEQLVAGEPVVPSL